jgi:hypothetical protein
MKINLDANVILCRSLPAAKAAKNAGVGSNGSRNALAPGPARPPTRPPRRPDPACPRAALEWAKDGIRGNIIHAHAIFDTGLWTEDVLQARAKNYGISVEEYKTNNLLKTEVYSRDFGEMAAEVCGPVFAKTTGAQLTIDGGSDRVI